MKRCESCGNSRIAVSENGFHPICTLSEKKSVDCLIGKKDYYDGQVKELSKKLCEESSCHHKCRDTEHCVVEDEAKVIIGEWKFDDEITETSDIVNSSDIKFIDEDGSVLEFDAASWEAPPPLIFDIEMSDEDNKKFMDSFNKGCIDLGLLFKNIRNIRTGSEDEV